MKIGIIDFSYKNFTMFSDSLANNGSFSVNLGDNCQSIAMRSLLASIGVDDCEIVELDRDDIATYAGEKIVVVLNAVFFAHNFPLSPNIVPIFLGFHASLDVIRANQEYLKAHQPIGCRDTWVVEQCQSLGIEAFLSGCVTMTLDRRMQDPSIEKTYFIYGENAGRLPMQVFSAVPRHILDASEIIYHRLPVFEYPLTPDTRRLIDGYERHIIKTLREKATLVVTSLHHIAAPCMAMGIPVIVARETQNVRFSFIEDLTKIYLPEDCLEIDWHADVIDVRTIQQIYTHALVTALRANASSL